MRSSETHVGATSPLLIKERRTWLCGEWRCWSPPTMEHTHRPPCCANHYIYRPKVRLPTGRFVCWSLIPGFGQSTKMGSAWCFRTFKLHQPGFVIGQYWQAGLKLKRGTNRKRWGSWRKVVVILPVNQVFCEQFLVVPQRDKEQSSNFTQQVHKQDWDSTSVPILGDFSVFLSTNRPNSFQQSTGCRLSQKIIRPFPVFDNQIMHSTIGCYQDLCFRVFCPCWVPFAFAVVFVGPRSDLAWWDLEQHSWLVLVVLLVVEQMHL